MSDYLIHSGKLGMKWYQHDKNAYQTEAGNWVYGRNKPSERDNAVKQQIARKVAKEVARARKTGEYDMEFLERNLDIDPHTDKQYKGKALDKAYAKYLTAEYSKSISNSETKSGNWVYGGNKPSESWNLTTEKTGSKTKSVNGKASALDILDIVDDAMKTNVVGKNVDYSPSRNQNCVSCAIAYDLRRAGNKVQSIETAEGMSAFVVADIYKKTKTTDYVISAKRTGTAKSLTSGMTDQEFDGMVNHLKSAGENSRGIITVNWKSKHGERYVGGHAMNYEVKNGKFYLIDSQSGEVFDEQGSRKQLSYAYDVMTLRTDNRRANLDYAKSYFVEPEGTKITDVSKGLKTAHTISKIGTGVRTAAALTTSPLMIASYVAPQLFLAALGSAGVSYVSSAVTTAARTSALTTIQKSRNQSAAKIIERLTGDTVDPKQVSANAISTMRRLPEYKRVYMTDTDDKHLDAAKIMSELKTTDNNGTNTTNNTTNRNRAPIPVALPTGRNGRNTRNESVDKERGNAINERVRRARETGKYDMEFLEKGLDVNQRTGNLLKGKELDKAYAEYLRSKSNSNNSKSKSAASQTTRNTSIGVTSSQKGSMKSLYAKGVPIDEIAEKLGVSPSTVSKYVR